MNRKNVCFYPIVLYTLFLLAVWVLSWFVGVFDLLTDDGRGVNSLVSAEGVRWAFRNAVPSFSEAPWAVAVFCVFSFGLVKSSELLHTVAILFSAKKMSANRRVAGYMALIAFVFCILLLFVSSVAPWRILMGVIPGFSVSPLVNGWPLLLLLVSFLVSVVHGFAFGVYRGFFDVLQGVYVVFAFFIPAFMAMLPASWVLSCLGFTGLVIDGTVLFFLSVALYLLPFLLCCIACMTEKGSSR